MKRILLVLLAMSLPLAAQVRVTQQEGKIRIDINGEHYSDLYYDDDGNKPYLHPLKAADGTIVSRMHPMADKEGELKDHPHHRGLWYSHGDVNGVDFWANEASYNRPHKGFITLNKVLELKNGEKQGSLTALFDWKGPKGELLVQEKRHMVFHADPNLRIVDVHVELTAKTDVKFGDTKEGTFALRTAPQFEEVTRKTPKTGPKRTGRLVNAEGVEGRTIWGKRAPWVDYSAIVEGKKLGIAIFDHPENPKHPTFWHARNYGLFAANPFGEHDFLRDRSLDGSISLRSGESITFRYRVLIHPGDEKDANVQKLYDSYAAAARASQ
jgi:hypothetical protein